MQRLLLPLLRYFLVGETLSSNGLKWLIAVGLVLGVGWVRVHSMAVEAYTQGESAEKSGNTIGAVDGYQRAMRAYTPFASAPFDGRKALHRLVEEAGKAGERSIALRALRAQRRAMRATRGLLDPFSTHRAAVDEHLAELTAQEQLSVGGPTIRGRSLQELRDDHRALLSLRCRF